MYKNTTHKEKIIQYIHYKRITVQKFCKSVGLSAGYFTHKGDLKSSMVQKIAETYNDLSLYWLLTGEGEMLKENSKAIAVPTDEIEALKKENEELRKDNQRLKKMIDKLL